MLTFNLTVCYVVRPIVGNSNNNAVSAAGSTLLLVHGGLVNDLPRNDTVPIARSSPTRLLISGGFKDNVAGFGEERHDGERIHL
jgi:hypothetical protein